jgi:hypothetical protein
MIRSSRQSKTTKQEDPYLKAIIDLTTSHRESRRLLKNEFQHYKLNAKLSQEIESLVKDNIPHYVEAIKKGHFYKRLSVEFNLKKKFISFIEFFDEDLEKEAAYHFTKEIRKNLEEQYQGEHYSIEDYLLKSIRPKLNPKVSRLEPSLETAILETALSPFLAAIKAAFNLSVESDQDLSSESEKVYRAVAALDIKMYKRFLNLVSSQSCSFQLLAYDFFYRKQLENNYKIFSSLALEYANRPYKLAKFISLSPYLFRRK